MNSSDHAHKYGPLPIAGGTHGRPSTLFTLCSIPTSRPPCLLVHQAHVRDLELVLAQPRPSVERYHGHGAEVYALEAIERQRHLFPLSRGLERLVDRDLDAARQDADV